MRGTFNFETRQGIPHLRVIFEKWLEEYEETSPVDLCGERIPDGAKIRCKHEVQTHGTVGVFQKEPERSQPRAEWKVRWERWWGRFSEKAGSSQWSLSTGKDYNQNWKHYTQRRKTYGIYYTLPDKRNICGHSFSYWILSMDT